MEKTARIVMWLGVFSLCCLRCAPAQETFTFYPVEDSWVNEANGAANYGGNSYLSLKDTSGSADVLLKFGADDFARLAGKQVVSATLSAYQYLGTYTPGDWLTLYKVNSGWSEGTVSWGSKPSYGGVPVSTLEVTEGVNEWRRWEGLASLVSSWVSDPQGNYGLALSNSLDGQNNELYSRFYSMQTSDLLKRPYLEITTKAAPEPVSSALFLLGAGALTFKRCRGRS